MAKATFRIWRGDARQGRVQGLHDRGRARAWSCSTPSTRSRPSRPTTSPCRWNCKAGKCGSCSAEINGMPKLMCMTRLNDLPLDEPVTVEPMQAFPLDPRPGHRRVVELRVKKKIKPFKPRKPDAPDGTWRMQQDDIDRVQEFRKCIECFLCQDVCHVLRDHHKHDEFIGPRFLVYAAALEMHPLDTEDRVAGAEEGARHRLLQHHQVLHEGLPRAHHDHRQRDHPAQGTRGRSLLRSDQAAVQHRPEELAENADPLPNPLPQAERGFLSYFPLPLAGEGRGEGKPI